MDGILVLDKPAGPTSHDMVALVRRLSHTRRVGHGGTLDPFARGVLPIFLGRGTRLVEYHMGDPKAYRATVCFGARSTTDDLDGELTPGDPVALSRDTVAEALRRFEGDIEQRPPDYSARRVDGRRAYEIVRGGERPDLAPRRVTIHAIAVESWSAADPSRPTAEIVVSCSAGTYIRAIARDLGDLLGCGAYLGGLVRTASGPFLLGDAHQVDEVRLATAQGRLAELLLAVDTGLEAMPRIPVDSSEVAALVRGQHVRPRDRSVVAAVPEGVPVRVVDQGGRLIAVARVTAGRLAPDKVLVDLEVPGPDAMHHPARPRSSARDALPASADAAETSA